MTTVPTNTERAERGLIALSAYTTKMFDDGNPETLHRDNLEAAIADLIADLMHLAASRGFDAEVVAARAHLHYEAEVREEAQHV